MLSRWLTFHDPEVWKKNIPVTESSLIHGLRIIVICPDNPKASSFETPPYLGAKISCAGAVSYRFDLAATAPLTSTEATPHCEATFWGNQKGSVNGPIVGETKQRLNVPSIGN